MLLCYAEKDSLYLECLTTDGVRQFASFGIGDDTDDSLEASADDIREFSGKGSLGFSDVVSLLGVCAEPAKEPDLKRYISFRFKPRSLSGFLIAED